MRAREILESKIITVPQDALDTVLSAIHEIKDHMKDWKTVFHFYSSAGDASLHIKLSETSQIEDHFLEEGMKISLGNFDGVESVEIVDLNNKKQTASIAVMLGSGATTAAVSMKRDMLILDIAAFSKHTLQSDIEHELVHLMDPKMNLKNAYSRSLANVGKQMTPAELHRYLTSLHEFDAFSTQIVKDIRKAQLKVAANIPASLDKMRSEIMKLLTVLRTVHSQEEVTTEHHEFSVLTEFLPNWRKQFQFVLFWMKKPTLYRRFLKRLHSGVLRYFDELIAKSVRSGIKND